MTRSGSIGGMSATNKPVKEVEIIDTKTMTWTTAPSLIIPLKYHTAIGFGKRKRREKKGGEKKS